MTDAVMMHHVCTCLQDSVSPSAQAAHTSVNGTAYKRMRSEEPEGPELNKLRSRNKVCASKHAITRLDRVNNGRS